jgi:lactoylglutathione lyase
MNPEPQARPNVRQAVPFFSVTNMEESYRYYVEGLGFVKKHQWVVEGKLRWCWLELGEAALMLQEYTKEGHDSWAPTGKLGVGVVICFQCQDALAIYREVTRRGLQAAKPMVGNGNWEFMMSDPDGYKIEFESPTDLPEETEFSE